MYSITKGNKRQHWIANSATRFSCNAAELEATLVTTPSFIRLPSGNYSHVSPFEIVRISFQKGFPSRKEKVEETFSGGLFFTWGKMECRIIVIPSLATALEAISRRAMGWKFEKLEFSAILRPLTVSWAAKNLREIGSRLEKSFWLDLMIVSANGKVCQVFRKWRSAIQRVTGGAHRKLRI